MRKLLLATTNKGKLTEMKMALETLPFDLISLADLEESIEPPEETGETFVANAQLKATYYAEKTGLLTVADDSGLVIDALEGWPGVHSAREIPEGDENGSAVVLGRMAEIPQDHRQAKFIASLCLVDPITDNQFITSGTTVGTITTEARGDTITFGFNQVFEEETLGKTYAEMTIEEKASVSHRGKAISELGYYLKNQYSGRHVVVAAAFILNEKGELLMSLRNDPHRPEFHKRWEFVGGTVEYGETVTETLVREVKEEVGYDVEILSPPLVVHTKDFDRETFKVQIYIVPFVCKIIGGDGVKRDDEVLETKWVPLRDVPSLHLFEGDDTMIEALIPEIEQYIDA